MATITKRVDRGIESGKRYQYWLSSENADDATVIAAGDIFMIEDSLGKPAKYLYIETTVGCNLTIRLNSQITRYRTKDEYLNWPVQYPELASPQITTDSSMAALVMGADEVWEIKGSLAISDIQIVSWSAGSFEVMVS